MSMKGIDLSCPSQLAKGYAKDSLATVLDLLKGVSGAAKSENADILNSIIMRCVAQIDNAREHIDAIQTIDDLAADIHDNALAHGWYDKQPSLGEQIANMHSELSEACVPVCKRCGKVVGDPAVGVAAGTPYTLPFPSMDETRKRLDKALKVPVEVLYPDKEALL